MFIFGKPYNELLDKYLYYQFRSREEENEYLNHLIDTINDQTICFEEKIAILNFMVSGVNAGILPPNDDRMTKERAAAYLDSIL
jgi:hypothetical protein